MRLDRFFVCVIGTLVVGMALSSAPPCDEMNAASIAVVSTGASVSDLSSKILADPDLKEVLAKAKALVASGFNAGDGYGEVWIRDFATFIELSCEVNDRKTIQDNLLTFFRFQGDDGNIVDGFIPASKANVNYEYIRKESVPEFVAHKNTVETDQESSLVQAIYLYVKKTGDRSILEKEIDGKTVLQRLAFAMEFLLTHRYSEKYELLWGATTSDWGDVQPEHNWGVVLDESSHRAIDIYDNAMFALAISNYLELLPADSNEKLKWVKVLTRIKDNARKYLWDNENQKFIPHVYLEGSPFPEGFDENEIYYHGGTAVAILAGFLTPNEVKASLDLMRENVRKSGAGSIGLTVYPPYPKGYFKNPSMVPYGYQNGGDWTWFGGRMIQALVQYGFVEDAYKELAPTIERVQKNGGFYEWYSVKNEPRGSGSFRGSAGVLAKAITMLYEWAQK